MAFSTWSFALGCLLFGCALACPPAHLIRPCICFHNSMVCPEIRGQDILDGVFRRMGNSKVDELILINSEVENIPASSLTHNGIQRLIIADSKMSQVFEVEPSISNKLIHLKLDNTTLENGLIFSHLRPLQRLQELLIIDTEVPELGQEFNINLSKSIKLVFLNNTKTRSIQGAFVATTKLEEVRVINGSLTSLDRMTFPFPAGPLKSLIFNGNQIDTLGPDQFEMMDNLRTLSFADNKIVEVSETIFGTIYDQIEVLILQGNPIKCDCSIKWLSERDSSGKLVTGTCVEPQSLAGKNIIELTPSDFLDC